MQSFLDLKTPIFGLLTEREFVELFGKVILKCEPINTLFLLIKNLSSTDNVFKLSKIVQLICLLIEKKFIEILECDDTKGF